MPAGTRIRDNGQFGAIADNPLTVGATTFNSPDLTFLPTVIGNHLVITLDPLRRFGAPEIVVVTAHTASATTVTVTRGAYGTLAREHPQGTEWVHAPIDEDFIEITLSGTRPTDPYIGQLIYENDTNYYMGYSGSAWEFGWNLLDWKIWNPTLANLTLGSGSVDARYIRIGRTVHYRFLFTLGAGSAVGTGPNFTLPVAPVNEGNGARATVGQAIYFESGGITNYGYIEPSTGAIAEFIALQVSGTDIVRTFPTASVPFTWGTSDSLFAAGTYEAVS